MFAARWITHFCAPVFVLLAGTSAGLMAARKSRREMAGFLFTRGAWLIAVEIVRDRHRLDASHPAASRKSAG